MGFWKNVFTVISMAGAIALNIFAVVMMTVKIYAICTLRLKIVNNNLVD